MTRRSSPSETFSQTSRKKSGKLRIANLQPKLKDSPNKEGLIIALLLLRVEVAVNGVVRGLRT